MFNLIPLSLLIMGLGGVIYIISDHLSEFSAAGGEDETEEFSFGIRAKLASWINQLPLDAVKVQSLSFTQKLLHKMRIIILKADNHLTKLIGKISEKDKLMNGKENTSNESGVDFWEDLASDGQKILQEKISEPEPEVKVDLTFKPNPETEKFFDIKPDKKANRVKIKKSSK